MAVCIDVWFATERNKTRGIADIENKREETRAFKAMLQQNDFTYLEGLDRFLRCLWIPVTSRVVPSAVFLP